MISTTLQPTAEENVTHSTEHFYPKKSFKAKHFKYQVFHALIHLSVL